MIAQNARHHALKRVAQAVCGGVLTPGGKLLGAALAPRGFKVLAHEQRFLGENYFFEVETDMIEVLVINRSPQIFERLALSCMDSYDSAKRRI